MDDVYGRSEDGRARPYFREGEICLSALPSGAEAYDTPQLATPWGVEARLTFFLPISDGGQDGDSYGRGTEDYMACRPKKRPQGAGKQRGVATKLWSQGSPTRCYSLRVFG